MPKPSIQTSIHGRRFGLGPKSELIFNDANAGLQDARLSPQATSRVILTSAQVLALNATPIELVAAPGATKVLLPNRLTAYKAAGTAYVAGAGEDLAVIHTGGSAVIAIDSASFLDSTAAEFRIGERVPANPETLDLTALANLALEATILVGEVTTGDSDIVVDLEYEVLDLVLTA
jgi:hypothetical protein